MAGRPFRWSDFFVRFLFIFGVLTATYNPTGYSYVDWLLNGETRYLAVKIFVGISLLILHGFILAMANKALGTTGSVLAVLFFTTLVWALYSLDLLPRAYDVLVVAGEAAIAATLAAGLSLAIIREQASGIATKLYV